MCQLNMWITIYIRDMTFFIALPPCYFLWGFYAKQRKQQWQASTLKTVTLQVEMQFNIIVQKYLTVVLELVSALQTKNYSVTLMSLNDLYTLQLDYQSCQDYSTGQKTRCHSKLLCYNISS